MEKGFQFLPVSRDEMIERGWYYYDFLIVSADGYIDHPSFGSTLIARLLESEGYRVAMLAQPKWDSAADFLAMGKPRYGVFIGGGNLDSMVAHYTVAKRRRTRDLYSPRGEMGHRPDRAAIVYANRAREAFPDTAIIVGGLEPSLRRFAHYDYWDDNVRRPFLFDAPADLLVYGMGEKATVEIARRLSRKQDVATITDVRGTAYITADKESCTFHSIDCPSYEAVCEDKVDYARANKIQYEEHDPIRGKAIIQPCQGRFLVVNPPQRPLNREGLDKLFALPYVREVHPMYEGGIPAIEEVRFSISHNRGCFGGCNFCALAFHQGRMVTSRSIESVLEEAELLTHEKEFKGYIHDVGGPSANFRHTSCKQQKEHGMCKNKSCLAPEPCKNLDPDHSEYVELLRRMREIPGIKKVFVRSGVRYDYMLQDKKGEFFRELVTHHVSGQLKVAPEHCVSSVLDYMGKPHFDVFLKFWRQYQKINEDAGKQQYIVPYLMSSHPGCTLEDAVELAVYLKKAGRRPEQVQDFYPTPGTLSTCMYYTGIDPRTMKEVYVARDPHDKALQRALLQWGRSEKRGQVMEALERTGRTDLIGYGPECLIRPDKGSIYDVKKPPEKPKTIKEKRKEQHIKDGTPLRRRKDGHKGKMSDKKKAAFAKQRAASSKKKSK